MIEEALKTILAEDATVAAITSRVHPVKLPQNPAYPLVRYIKISGAAEHHLRGPSSLKRARFQIEAWDKTLLAAKELARAVEGRLDGYLGTVAGVSIKSCILISERDAYAEAVDCELVIQDYSIWYREL